MYSVTFPQRAEHDVSQDDEWCEVAQDGQTERIRFHDYADIYRRPGLYEQLFDTELECRSPRVVTDLLAGERHRLDGAPLRVLDVGAGNGMVGERLRAIGAETVIGCDILPEAKAAAQRDRPDVYDDYLAADLTALSLREQALLAAAGCNAMTVVAALGFGDIPCSAFTAAYGYVADGGLVAFNLKDEFLADGDRSGFAALVDRAERDGAMEVVARERYRHRLSVTGEPLEYVALVAVKRGALG